MPLVPAVCPNCKGTLEVNPAQDAAICRFCGTPFIVEKAINQYNTTNNFNANVINYYASDNSDFVIRGGVLEKYNGASTEVMIPNGVIEVKPDVFRGTYVRSISLPSSIKVICLLDCPSLSIIQIPVSVHIKMLSIIGCDALKNIVLNGVIEELNINNCNNLSDIPLRSNIKSISIRNCEKLTNIVIPQDVKSLRLTLSRLNSINLHEAIN